MKKIYLIIFCFCASFAFDLKDLEKNLHVEKIDGNFTQIKNIKNFPMPFKSSGEFAITGSDTLFWNTKIPIKNQIKIDKNGIFTQDENQKWIKTSQIDKGIFLDLISLNKNKLNETFTHKLKGDKKKWTLELEPKSFLLKKIFNDIKIQGSSKIKSFDINETSGNFTHIEFEINEN
ncbi:MAG: outer membrane lipoprotein carrier protein LolA [Arcobacter sp.]|nr:outer membrane lipoprotein carrier protein LolA [Arcobacter sp.]